MPPRLLLFPRPDLAPAGVVVTELRLRAHDGLQLKGILGHSSFARGSMEIRLRLVPEGDPEELDWEAIRSGRADLVLRAPPGAVNRRLEDRVIDVLRLALSTRKVEDLRGGHFVVSQPGERPKADELWIAERLLEADIC